MAGPLKLTRTHRILVGLVVAGAVVIAGIGFAGSYAAVRSLALRKGFGNFSYVFPIGIDAGICVLLALDLLLTWIRIPFPLLRQTAWVLTLATIAFNGATAWPDPLGVGMHAVIPVLFVVSVEAARHAVGRIADITADKHMEGVRLTRWLLSPLPTFLLWRRMKLWELRSYEATIKLEQERLVYQARLRSRFGRTWRRKAPIESLMPLRLARYGVPLQETAPAGLAAAGIEPALISAVPKDTALRSARPQAALGGAPADPGENEGYPEQWEQQPQVSPWFATNEQGVAYGGGYDPQYVPEEQYEEWYTEQQPDEAGFPPGSMPAAGPQGFEGQGQRRMPPPQGQFPQGGPQPGMPQGQFPQGQFPQGVPAQGIPPQSAAPQEYANGRAAQDHRDGGVRVPAGPGGRTRPLGGAAPGVPGNYEVPIPAPRREAVQDDSMIVEDVPSGEEYAGPAADLPDDLSREEAYFQAYRRYANENGHTPNARQLGLYIQDLYGIGGQSGGPLAEATLRPYVKEFNVRFQQDLDAEHIA